MATASMNTRKARLAGLLLIASILAAFIYRFFIVTAILGDVNSRAVLSGYQRGILNLGVVFAAIIVSAGLAALLAFLRGTSAYRLALAGLPALYILYQEGLPRYDSLEPICRALAASAERTVFLLTSAKNVSEP